MADITKAVSANDIKNGTSVTGVDGTGNIQAHFDAAKDSNSPSLSDIENKYSTRFDDTTYYSSRGLARSLRGYYELDELSGTRVDSQGGIDLTDNNTTGYVSGVSSAVGNAASFIRSNLEYLSVDNSSIDFLSPGDSSFSIAFWHQRVTLDIVANQHLCGIWKGSGGNKEYLIRWQGGSSQFRFYTSANGSSISYLGSNSVLGDPPNSWYHLVFCHDADNDQRLIYVDGVLDASDSYSSGIYQGSGDFNIGRTQESSNYVSGAIDEWGMWDRVLTADDVSSLYNAGDGLKVI
tara:strand:- start:4653 stop:5528 length:876 start_codon:yes stop_codon:yes gene_type:complete